MKKNQNRTVSKVYSHYIDNPVDFVQDFIHVTPQPWQCDVLNALAEYDRIALKAGNGIGKTAFECFSAIWFMSTRPSAKVPMTAGVARQVDIFWSEYSRWFRNFDFRDNIDLLSNSAYMLDGKGNHIEDWFTLGFTASDPARAEGFHADHLLYITDEGKGVKDEICDAITGALTGKENKWLFCSVPGYEQGFFHKIFTTFRKNWKCFSFPSAVKDKSGSWIPNPLTPQVTAESIKDKLGYGEDSPIFTARVKADFIKSGSDNLITLDWVETAINAFKPKSDWRNTIGHDVARYGDDESVIVYGRGSCIEGIEGKFGIDTNENAGWIKNKHKQLNAIHSNIDIIGVGAGVYDQSKSIHGINGVNVSMAANDHERFYNLRAELYWNLRERFENTYKYVKNGERFDEYDLISLSGDDQELISQLTVIKYKFHSNGKIIMESKEDMKKRIGKSPDRADALMLKFFRPKTIVASKIMAAERR